MQRGCELLSHYVSVGTNFIIIFFFKCIHPSTKAKDKKECLPQSLVSLNYCHITNLMHTRIHITVYY